MLRCWKNYFQNNRNFRCVLSFYFHSLHDCWECLSRIVCMLSYFSITLKYDEGWLGFFFRAEKRGHSTLNGMKPFLKRFAPCCNFFAYLHLLLTAWNQKKILKSRYILCYISNFIIQQKLFQRNFKTCILLKPNQLIPHSILLYVIDRVFFKLLTTLSFREDA